MVDDVVFSNFYMCSVRDSIGMCICFFFDGYFFLMCGRIFRNIDNFIGYFCNYCLFFWIMCFKDFLDMR